MDQHITFATKRLRVASTPPPLIPELTALLTPSVLEHLPDPLHLEASEGAVEHWLEDRTNESDVLSIRSANGRLLGLLILAETAPSTVHIGYLMAETTWGQGLGTELIGGLVDWFRTTKEAVVLMGGVATDNIGSARVLQKNGFARDPSAPTEDTEMYVLRLARS